MSERKPGIRLERVALAALLLGLACAGLALAGESGEPAEDMSLRGGEEGTAFESMTIEGEDRVRVEFRRPELSLSLDPLSVGGLEGGSAGTRLLAGGPDPVAPFLAASTGARSPFLARPWLDRFASGTLVRFRPALEGVARWSLVVADSRGDTTAVFAGDGKPPQEIGWDGRDARGEMASPGLTYSYVLTAWDRAGNKRNFVGEGFELPAYRLPGGGGGEGGAMILAGRHLETGGREAPALLLGAADRLNRASADRTVEVAATARSFADAERLARRVAEALAPRLLGDPLRLRTLADVDPGAPADGIVRIAVR